MTREDAHAGHALPDSALTVLVLQVGDGYSVGEVLSSADSRFQEGRGIRLVSPNVTGKAYTTMEYEGESFPVTEPRYEAHPRRVYCAVFGLLRVS